MRKLGDNSDFPKNVSLILGFFDGIHAGHQKAIKTTSENKKVLVTFSSSPAEYFGKDFKYIYSRNKNYELLESLGIDYIYERNFADLAKISAEDYLSDLINKFNPKSITTGFNHTFGANKQGNYQMLENYREMFEYFCVPPIKVDDIVVSSSIIKNILSNGNIEKANKFLTRNFSLTSTVIEGAKLGRTIGFPTANMKYPDRIVKIPYGVYKVKVLNKPAIMNWGVKPTIGAEEIMEVYIPNFGADLYGKELTVEITSKIRDEIKFNSLEELTSQIKKDVEKCLK